MPVDVPGRSWGFGSVGSMSITPFSVNSTAIDGLMIMQIKEIRDDRGVVREFYRESSFLEAGLPSLGKWLQMNVTESNRGVIRGLHGEDMYKLIGIVAGEAFGAWVDVRPGSPSRGKVVTQQLAIGTQVLVPAGVCNAFNRSATRPRSTYTRLIKSGFRGWLAVRLTLWIRNWVLRGPLRSIPPISRKFRKKIPAPRLWRSCSPIDWRSQCSVFCAIARLRQCVFWSRDLDEQLGERPQLSLRRADMQ